MKLIITQSIERSELLPLKSDFSVDLIQAAAKRALRGIGKNIKSSVKLPKTCLKKLNLTSSGSAGRVVFLLEIGSRASVLVMLRAKNDKKIGANMTIKNPYFRKLLENNIDLILQDISKGNYQAFRL